MKFMCSAFFPIILIILIFLLLRIRATPGLMNAEHRRIRATPGLVLRRPGVSAERVAICGKKTFHLEWESQLKNQ
jgi:hypothetical protein